MPKKLPIMNMLHRCDERSEELRRHQVERRLLMKALERLKGSWKHAYQQQIEHRFPNLKISGHRRSITA